MSNRPEGQSKRGLCHRLGYFVFQLLIILEWYIPYSGRKAWLPDGCRVEDGESDRWQVDSHPWRSGQRATMWTTWKLNTEHSCDRSNFLGLDEIVKKLALDWALLVECAYKFYSNRVIISNSILFTFHYGNQTLILNCLLFSDDLSLVWFVHVSRHYFADRRYRRLKRPYTRYT